MKLRSVLADVIAGPMILLGLAPVLAVVLIIVLVIVTAVIIRNRRK